MTISKKDLVFIAIIFILLLFNILNGGTSRDGGSSFFTHSDTLIVVDNKKELEIIDSLKESIKIKEKDILSLNKEIEKIKLEKKETINKIDSLPSNKQAELLHQYLRDYEY